MSIRIAAAAFAISLAAGLAPTGVAAQANVMKECGAEYQTAKAAKTLGEKKWNEFLSECRTRKAAATPAATTTAAPAAQPTAAPAAPPAGMAPTAGVSPSSKTPSATTTEAKPAATGGRAAMLERQKACGTEWKAQKVELRKAKPDLKWPQFWSDCNKRMKAAAKS